MSRYKDRKNNRTVLLYGAGAEVDATTRAHSRPVWEGDLLLNGDNLVSVAETRKEEWVDAFERVAATWRDASGIHPACFWSGIFYRSQRYYLSTKEEVKFLKNPLIPPNTHWRVVLATRPSRLTLPNNPPSRQTSHRIVADDFRSRNMPSTTPSSTLTSLPNQSNTRWSCPSASPVPCTLEPVSA